MLSLVPCFFLKSFKSCPREGASHYLIGGNAMNYKVSSHAPVRGHLRHDAFITRHENVSSHAPVRGHLKSINKSLYDRYVSSHAPVRGHPWRTFRLKNRKKVSSHAPVRGHLFGCECSAVAHRFQVMPP